MTEGAVGFLKGGFELPDPKASALAEEEQAVIRKLARQTVQRRMTVPAILFLESVKPLNYIGSQVLVFFEPIIQTLFNFRDYDVFRTALEKRESIETLIVRIEEYDAIAVKRERAFKKWYRQEKKKWKWYQRYLGLFAPALQVPPEIYDGIPDFDEADKTDTSENL